MCQQSLKWLQTFTSGDPLPSADTSSTKLWSSIRVIRNIAFAQVVTGSEETRSGMVNKTFRCDAPAITQTITMLTTTTTMKMHTWMIVSRRVIKLSEYYDQYCLTQLPPPRSCWVVNWKLIGETPQYFRVLPLHQYDARQKQDYDKDVRNDTRREEELCITKIAGSEWLDLPTPRVLGSPKWNWWT